MRRITSIEDLRAAARTRRAPKRAKRKPRIDYGRRVRSGPNGPVPVLPHTGPKPKERRS